MAIVDLAPPTVRVPGRPDTTAAHRSSRRLDVGGVRTVPESQIVEALVEEALSLAEGP